MVAIIALLVMKWVVADSCLDVVTGLVPVTHHFFKKSLIRFLYEERMRGFFAATADVVPRYDFWIWFADLKIRVT